MLPAAVAVSMRLITLLAGLAGVLGVSFGQTTWGGGGVTIGCDPDWPSQSDHWYGNFGGKGDTPGTCKEACRTDPGGLLSESAKAQGYKFM